MYCSLLSFTNFSYLAPFYSCFLLLPLILYHTLFTCYFLLIFITYSGTSCHAVRSPLILYYLLSLWLTSFVLSHFLSMYSIFSSPFFSYFLLSFTTICYLPVFFHALLLPLSLCYFLLLMLFSTVLLCIIYSTTSSHSLSLPHLIFSHSDLLPFILFCILPPHTITCYSTFCHLLSSFTSFYYLYNFLLLFIIYSTTLL